MVVGYFLPQCTSPHIVATLLAALFVVIISSVVTRDTSIAVDDESIGTVLMGTEHVRVVNVIVGRQITSTARDVIKRLEKNR